MKLLATLSTTAILVAGLAAGEAQAQTGPGCPVKLGGILPLTGSMGPVGKRIADSAQLAVKHVNEGGGVKGCPVQFILRDDQGQPTVGVDAAYLLFRYNDPRVTLAILDAAVSLVPSSTNGGRTTAQGRNVVQQVPTNNTPEPASIAVFLTAIASVGLRRRALARKG